MGWSRRARRRREVHSHETERHGEFVFLRPSNQGSWAQPLRYKAVDYGRDDRGGHGRVGKGHPCLFLFDLIPTPSHSLVEHCFLFQTNRVQGGPAGGVRAKEQTRSVGVWSGYGTDTVISFRSFAAHPLSQTHKTYFPFSNESTRQPSLSL